MTIHVRAIACANAQAQSKINNINNIVGGGMCNEESLPSYSAATVFLDFAAEGAAYRGSVGTNCA